ncbi:MAG: molybdopterin-synthase adenylyltransferase MoeB [Gemmatimonadota bacterium]|nr:molybdopterin-synthase adenylyltransferase MoeB [Gemmatimonadota bacterium]
MLSPDELLRYSRHLMLPRVGIEGQHRLKSARMLIVGAGGLGSPAALYLAAAGVGHIGLVDFDAVDASNLQRQILYGTSDVGRPKLDAARERLEDLNPHIQVEPYSVRLTRHNALEIVGEYDIVVDGTDNFATRYLTNDACVILGKPNVYGSIFRFEGQASVFATKDGPCYRCLFREPPPAGSVPSCEEGGVLGVLPGLIGTIQATEAVKLVLGIGESLAGRLLMVDALSMQFRTLTLERDPTCPVCGTREIQELIDYDAFCGSPVQDDAVVCEITADDLRARLESGDVELIDVREPREWESARIDGARLIPLDSIERALSTLPRDRDIVLYCKSGSRSAAAARTLRSAGITRVSSLAGGLNSWGA